MIFELETNTAFTNVQTKTIAKPAIAFKPTLLPITKPEPNTVIESTMKPNKIPKLMIDLSQAPKTNLEVERYSNGCIRKQMKMLVLGWLQWKKEITSDNWVWKCKCTHHFIHSTQYIYFQQLNQVVPFHMLRLENHPNILNILWKTREPAPEYESCDFCRTYLCSICSREDIKLKIENHIRCTHPRCLD